MTQSVIHQPRVAWDGARAFVRASTSRHYDGFAGRVAVELGPEIHGALADTREHLLTAYLRTGGDRYATDVEAGKWRVRLEDLLRERPDVTGAVRDLTAWALEL